jgi:SNF2 family DNA or RNA helicase
MCFSLNHQALSRVYRQGQRFNVNVRIGLAEGTIQHRLHQRLLDNDQLANTVQGGFQDLRDAIYGK